MIQLKSMYMNEADSRILPADMLYNAVILQAVKDFRQARKRLKRNPGNREASKTVGEVCRFFRSDYFTALTRLNGPALLSRLMEEA